MPLQRFVPTPFDRYISNDKNQGTVKFGHLNAVVDYINNNVIVDGLQLEGEGPLTATPRYITDNVGNLSSLAISSSNIGIGTNTPGARLEIYGGADTLGISGPANQAKSIQIARYNNSSYASHYIGDDGGSFFGDGLTISSSGSNSQLYLQVSSAGRNVNIGTAGSPTLSKNLGARLGIRGSGSSSATTSLLVQNSGGSNLFTVLDDGNVGIGVTNPTGKLQVSGSILAGGNGYTSVGAVPNAYGSIGSNYYVSGNNYVYLNNDFVSQLTFNNGGYQFRSAAVGSSGSVINSNTIATLDSTGQLSLALNTTLSAKLGIRGSGSTSATTSLLVQNSGGNNIFSVTDDGSVTLGISGSGSIHSFYGSAGLIARLSGGTIELPQSISTIANQTVYWYTRNNNGQGVTFEHNNSQQSTSTGIAMVNIGGGYGTQHGAQFSSLQIAPTYDLNANTTTSAIARGIYYNPTITNLRVAQHYAWQNTSGAMIVNSSTPNASAILQADSNTQGFLPPRMTTVQRTAITSPAAGLIVYDTTTNKSYTYDGTTWQAHW